MATVKEVVEALTTVRGVDAGRCRYLSRELQSRGMLPVGHQGGGRNQPHVTAEQTALFLVALACPGPAPKAATWAESFMSLECSDAPHERFSDALAFYIRQRGMGAESLVESLQLIFDADFPYARIQIWADGLDRDATFRQYDYENGEDYDRAAPALAQAAMIDGDVIARLSRLLRTRAEKAA